MTAYLSHCIPFSPRVLIFGAIYSKATRGAFVELRIVLQDTDRKGLWAHLHGVGKPTSDHSSWVLAQSLNAP